MYNEKNIKHARQIIEQVYIAHFKTTKSTLFRILSRDKQVDALNSYHFLMQENIFNHLASAEFTTDRELGNRINHAIRQIISLLDYLTVATRDNVIPPQEVFAFTPWQYCQLSKYALIFFEKKFNPVRESTIEISDEMVTDFASNVHPEIINNFLQVETQPPSEINMEYPYTSHDMNILLQVIFLNNTSLLLMSPVDEHTNSYLEVLKYWLQFPPCNTPEYSIFMPALIGKAWVGILFQISSLSITGLHFLNSSKDVNGANFLTGVYCGLLHSRMITRSVIPCFPEGLNDRSPVSSGPLLIQNLYHLIHHQWHTKELSLRNIRQQQLGQLQPLPEFYQDFLQAQRNYSTPSLPRLNFFNQNNNNNNNNTYPANSDNQGYIDPSLVLPHNWK